MKSYFKITLALLAGSALLSSCGTPEKKTSKTVRIGSFFTAVDYAPYLIAKNKHLFEDSLKKQGDSVAYTEFQTLPSINEALATNKIDIVFEAEPPAIIGSAAGTDVAIKDISCSLIQEILVGMKSKIKTVADLKGAKIAVLAGTSSHYGVLKMLKDNGISASDVKILDMAPPDAKAAFESGQVDAWAVWPPFTEQEEISGIGRVLPHGDAYINSIMAVRGGFIKSDSAEYKTVSNIFRDTKKWMIANPDSAINLMAKILNVPQPVVKKAWPVHNWNATLDDKVVADIQAKADFLKQTGKIQNAVTVKGHLVPVQ